MRTSSFDPRADHLHYVGTIRPIDDPWWNTHTPPLGWGCKCSLRQTRADATAVPPDGDPISPVFQNNPGKTAAPVTYKHPYFPKSCTACPLPGKREIILSDPHSLKSLQSLEAQSTVPDCNHCKKAMTAADREIYKIEKFKSGGVLETPTIGRQNKNEYAKNKKAFGELAKFYAYKYRLLPVSNIPKKTTTDAINLTSNQFSDAKIPTGNNAKNAIQSGIKEANRQGAKEVFIYFEKQPPMADVWAGLKAALLPDRNKNIETVIIRLNREFVKTYDAGKLRNIFKNKGKTG